MKTILKFIVDKFPVMPKKIQITTYITFVALFVYMVTLPNFIDMKLVSIIDGNEFPVIDAEIQVEVSGRAIRILTDENGRFSVPISIVLPTSKIIFVLRPNPDKNSIKEVEIPVSNSYIKRSKLIFHKENSTYEIEPDGVSRSLLGNFATLSLVSSAYANIKNNISYNDAEDVVLGLISRVSKMKVENITKSYRLKSDLNLDNIDLSYINSNLKNKFDIDIWMSLKNEDMTVRQLIESIVGKDTNLTHGAENASNHKIERRKKVFTLDERNGHCVDERPISYSVNASTGWKIDTSSIQSNVNLSSRSIFEGIVNPTEEGFEVAGTVINNGRCITLLGSDIFRDGRGRIWGEIEYEEYR